MINELELDIWNTCILGCLSKCILGYVTCLLRNSDTFFYMESWLNLQDLEIAIYQEQSNV